ncbi:hypothetical protein SISSUDRAFT_516856 [Sistotremastrum suecicum HHB10207 ss-3]|uniref:Uncharacterized protein n=1 Tax=Sistotremastrum suecicum HHB10207 ss-3 TaxID=1314776 RepID=A0A166F8M7_9AGAM|nr:hypothetical protein SISSUDRAFT_516856 [Sistotremastrum suecicum HHB10207 ss-3]
MEPSPGLRNTVMALTLFIPLSGIRTGATGLGLSLNFRRTPFVQVLVETSLHQSFYVVLFNFKVQLFFTVRRESFPDEVNAARSAPSSCSLACSLA